MLYQLRLFCLYVDSTRRVLERHSRFRRTRSSFRQKRRQDDSYRKAPRGRSCRLFSMTQIPRLDLIDWSVVDDGELRQLVKLEERCRRLGARRLGCDRFVGIELVLVGARVGIHRVYWYFVSA